jgi:hypothetical protein
MFNNEYKKKSKTSGGVRSWFSLPFILVIVYLLYHKIWERGIQNDEKISAYKKNIIKGFVV